jgi:DNA topoisomerase-1
VTRLRRSDCSGPGYGRRRCGGGFTYYGADGKPLTDPGDLERIRSLAIPPAWKDVWICPWPGGHIQAMGTDDAGRRQYLYHEKWRQRRDAEKFDHMLEFARALPRLRARCARLLARDDLSRERVLACATRLLDVGFFRIGSEDYAEDNGSYGLATLRKEHVTLHRDGSLTFDYPAKSGQQRLQSVVEPKVYAVVAALKRRRSGGPELLAWRDDGKGWCDVRSEDINAFIKEVSGGDFTAKDFRTWTATVLAAVALAVSAAVRSDTGRKRAVARAMREVAGYLGNTPAVCRRSYIDPRVVDRYLDGQTIAGALSRVAEADGGSLAVQGAIEKAVLGLLES